MKAVCDTGRAHAQAAVDLGRALFGEGRALADALMTQAGVERAAGQPDRALTLWREARRILLSDQTALAQLQSKKARRQNVRRPVLTVHKAQRTSILR